LESENIFVMTENRAMTQDIRPLRIALLNLMPTKVATETQLLRMIGHDPDSGGDGERIDDMHAVIPDHCLGDIRALTGARKRGGEQNADQLVSVGLRALKMRRKLLR